MDAFSEDFEVSVENIKAVIAVLKKEGKSDPETAHALESNVVSMTVKFLAKKSKELTKAEMVEYLNLLVELYAIDFPRWFA